MSADPVDLVELAPPATCLGRVWLEFGGLIPKCTA
jgi:hypothetical protein